METSQISLRFFKFEFVCETFEERYARNGLLRRPDYGVSDVRISMVTLRIASSPLRVPLVFKRRCLFFYLGFFLGL